MTLLPWAWFVVGSLVGGGLLAALVLLWARVCRPADGVRAFRLAHAGLLAVVLVQAFGWVPRVDVARPTAGHVVSDVGEAGVAGPVEQFAPVGVAVWPVGVWLAGTVGVAVVFVWRRVRLNRLRRLPPFDDPDVRDRVAGIAARLGVTRPPDTLTGRAACSPFVFGVARPVLVLPPDFACVLSPAHQEAVLAHELAHLTGRDPLWTAVGEGLLAVLWWNPLAWWLVARHRAACEVAADDSTGGIPDGPGLLAESLFALAARMTTAHPRPASAAGGRCRSALARRVTRLLTAGPTPPPRGRFGRLVRVGVWCGIVAAMVAGMTLTRAAGGPDEPSLVAHLWPVPVDTPPPVVPRTLGDLHPELRADPRDADLADLQLATVRPQSVNRAKPAEVDEPPATEEAAFDHVGASAEQRAKLNALKAENWEATKAMYRAPADERRELGLAINRRWRAGLQEVLTADQYRRYLEFWKGRPVVAVRLPN